RNDEVEWQQVDTGVERKIMAFDKDLMMVKVRFQKGGIGALHQHHHSQITYIMSGVFEIEIENEKQILTAGDVYYIPPNELHGAVCIEEGI
ncbi:cupin domain-containing protein, partial [Acinetobacter baumannii]